MFRSTFLLALLVSSRVAGFTPSTKAELRQRSHQLHLTSEEILARARKASGMPDDGADEEYPKVYEDDLLADMQSALIKLDRRVQEGPGSLSPLEVEELDSELQRVMEEMRVNGDVRPVKKARTAAETVVDAEATPVKSVVTQNTPPAPKIVPDGVTLDGPAKRPKQDGSITDTSEFEGPAYDGSGGMGQPKGTVNTYIIEGMDEMTSEEYRLALERSLIDRQRERREQGIIGNKSSWDYLNSISAGDTGPLRKDYYDDKADTGPKKKKTDFKPYGQK